MGIEQVERDGLFDHTVPCERDQRRRRQDGGRLTERPGFGSSEASAKGVDTDVGPTGDVCGGAVDVAVWSGAPVDCDICGGEGCEACGVGGGGGGGWGEGDGLPGGGGGGGVEGGEEGEGGVEGVVVGCLESGGELWPGEGVLTLSRRPGCRWSCRCWGETSGERQR